jgi:serine/threonine protein kinase
MPDTLLSPTDVSITKSSVIGRGAYGIVYSARWKELTCAAKIIHSTLLVLEKPEVVEQLEMECLIISRFRHPNIVQFLGMTRDSDTMFPVLLMELMERSLTVLLEESVEPLPYSKQIDICHDIALAITYLHSAGFIHRDISSNNVLMKGDTAKLTDLGVAVLINSRAPSRLTTCPGSEVYMPPDSVGENPNYTEKIDCFSFGVLGVQIATCKFPCPGTRYIPLKNSRNLVQVVPEVERRRDHLNMIDPTHPLLDLFRSCLKDEEPDRPTAVDICRHVAHLRAKAKESVASNVPNTYSGTLVTGSLSRLSQVSVAESYESRLEQLRIENEHKDKEIIRLKREKAELLQLSSSQQVSSMIH